MANWKKVITANDDSTHKNESITLAQLFAGLDADSTAGANQVLKANSNHTALAWATDSGVTLFGGLTDITNSLGTSNAGAIPVGGGDGNYTTIIPTGDVTMSTAGAMSIGDEKINSDHYVDGSIDTIHIADDQVTYAKMQDIGTANRVLGNTSTGTVAEVQVATAMIADDAVTGDKLATNIDIAGTLDVTSTATFDAGIVVTGDLTVTGDLKTTNITDLDVEDKTITLAVASYLSDTDAVDIATGSGIRVMTDSGTDNTSINNYASVAWNKSGEMSGWQVKDTATTTAFDVSVMEFSSNSTAPTGNASGVGSFHFDKGDDTLYVRISD